MFECSGTVTKAKDTVKANNFNNFQKKREEEKKQVVHIQGNK